MWGKDQSELQAFVGDERAVPSVVGTLFMVAIVVILAALIGKFVFGLDIVQGGQQSVAPQFSYDSEYNGTTLKLEHTGGDSLKESDIEVVGSESGTFSGPGGDWDITNGDGDGEWENGEILEVGTTGGPTVESSETVRVVWQSSKTGDTATVVKWNG